MCPPSSLALILSRPPVQKSSITPEERDLMDIPFRTECSKVSHSTYFMATFVLISPYLLQKESFLMVAKEGADVCMQQNEIRNHFIGVFL